MTMIDIKASLANLAEGAAIELFDQEMTRVLENILDPNRQTKKVREINLKVMFTPTDAPGIVMTTTKISSKLAGRRSVSSHMMVEYTERGIVARELHQQQKFGFEDELEKEAENRLYQLRGGKTDND